MEVQPEDLNNPSTAPAPPTKQGVGGGANTTIYGKLFETHTDMFHILQMRGFIKSSLVKIPRKPADYCLCKTIGDKKITYLTQTGFKVYMHAQHAIKTFRLPDEAYIVETITTGDKILKILEKKEQRCEGSVETKLWAGPAFIDEYTEILDHHYKVEYGFCVNRFLQHKILSNDTKFIIFNKIMKKYSIPILFGEKRRLH